jgi:type IV secretion system protein TrbG
VRVRGEGAISRRGPTAGQIDRGAIAAHTLRGLLAVAVLTAPRTDLVASEPAPALMPQTTPGALPQAAAELQPRRDAPGTPARGGKQARVQGRAGRTPSTGACACGGKPKEPVAVANGKSSAGARSTPRSPSVSPSVVPHAALAPTAQPVAAAATVAFRRQTPGERPQTAAERLEGATREYRETGVARPVVIGSVVAFPYGVGEPVLRCAALRVCVVDLEPGEHLVSRPIAGDVVRWHIGTAPAGPDGAGTLVWAKPTDCDLSTNLVLSTDRRVYQVMLEAPPCDRASTNPRANAAGPDGGGHLTFYFPDATVPGAVPRSATPADHRVAGGLGGGARNAAPDATPASTLVAARRGGDVPGGGADPAIVGITVDVTRLNFDYRVKRDRNFPWSPAQVFDDGVHTFIKIPPEAAAHAAPALFELPGGPGGDDDAKTLLNYTVRDGFYVTDRTFRRAALVLGQGKHERRVHLENPRFGTPAAGPASGTSRRGSDGGGRDP